MRIKPIAGQFLFLLALSIGLIALDHKFQGRNLLKQYLSLLASPIYSIVGYPGRATDWLGGWFNDRQLINSSIEQLELENALLKIKLQQIQDQKASQDKLLSLSLSAQNISDKIMVGNILKVNLERQSLKIVVDKGHNDTVYLGQPVVDQFGIVGQVTDLSVTYSIVTLITDASQSTPVLVKRNNLRALLYGTGHAHNMVVKYLGMEADIRAGDQLISSGIGNRFPPGHPVAEVVEVNKDENESFLQISAKPIAQLGHGKQVLLIWPKSQQKRRNPYSQSVDRALSVISQGSQ